ncbi:MAG: hypothetical protein J6Y25_06750 [Elusimicrobiaceae bacterium]|nr:hypothetical protein [Elusimicrobiaceae bacterium]
MKRIRYMLIMFLRVYFPVLYSKITYYFTYKLHCDLKNPRTFSEKLLWLSLHTYRNNMKVLMLCDKYLVREYVATNVGPEILNKLYGTYESDSYIDFNQLPHKFVFKISQGCTTNLLCPNKDNLTEQEFKKKISPWRKQYLYDRLMAQIGGIPVSKLKKWYICEKYLDQKGHSSLTDYKIYCFNGKPLAILVINERFGNQNAIFMSPKWEILGKPIRNYHLPTNLPGRPPSLQHMLKIASKLSQGFPFVRVDLYDIQGQVVFGEMTFFPHGCIGMAEIKINGESMGDLLDISAEMKKFKG